MNRTAISWLCMYGCVCVCAISGKSDRQVHVGWVPDGVCQRQSRRRHWVALVLREIQSLTRVPARLPNPNSTGPVLSRPSAVVPEDKLLALVAVVQMARVRRYWPQGATLALAAALGPGLDASTVHTHLVWASDPLVPATGVCAHHSCQPAHVPGTHVGRQLDHVMGHGCEFDGKACWAARGAEHAEGVRRIT